MGRLLVTGANGFTGRHVVTAAKKLSYEVVGLKSDLTQPESLISELRAVSPTHVIHLGAISSVSHADHEAFYKVNLFGTLNLLEAIRKLPYRTDRIVLASSANIYGNASVERISEVTLARPANHYAMSKVAMELMAANYLEELPIVLARPFNYTGAGHDTRFLIPKIVEHFRTNQSTIELGNLDVYREYNDVRMVCDVYLRLLNSGAVGEIYNICTGRCYSLNDVIKTAEEIAGRRIDVHVNQAFVRANEVRTLVGDPAKLKSAVGELRDYTLADTLGWMLSE